MVQMNNAWEFPVQLQDIFTKDGKLIPRHKTAVRTDTNEPLSIVSDRYKLYTHGEVLNSVQPFIREFGEGHFKHSLERNGARLIATYQFRDHSLGLHNRKGKHVGDTIFPELHVINSYNSTTALEFKLGASVLICLNGMTIFSDMFSLRFKHLGTTWAGELPKPQTILAAFKQGAQTWERWGDTTFTKPTEIEEVTNELVAFGVVGKTAIESNRGNLRSQETVWDLYNAITHMITHSPRKTQTSGKINRYDRLNAVFSTRFAA